MKNKKLTLLSVALALILITTSFYILPTNSPAVVLAEEKTKVTILGDVNEDGKVTAADARLVLRISAKLSPTPNEIVCADINNDNEITAADARSILRVAASLTHIDCERYEHNITDNNKCSRCSYSITHSITVSPPSTTSIPTTIPTASSSESYDIVTEIFNEINAYRASVGLYPFKFNESLSKISSIRAKEASVKWSHTRPDGRAFYTVFSDYDKFDNVRVAEILAKVGTLDAKRVVNGWNNSPNHHTIIITTIYTEIGIGVYEYNGKLYVAAHTI